MSPVHELPLVHAFLQLIDIALRNRLVATLGSFRIQALHDIGEDRQW